MNDRRDTGHHGDAPRAAARHRCNELVNGRVQVAEDRRNQIRSPGEPLTDRAISQDDFDRVPSNGAADETHAMGPGSELKRMLPWLSKAAKSGLAKHRIITMNKWGSKGCRLNLETIAAWLVSEAIQHGMEADDLPLATARALVQTAIGRFERKFPDGSLEGD